MHTARSEFRYLPPRALNENAIHNDLNPEVRIPTQPWLNEVLINSPLQKTRISQQILNTLRGWGFLKYYVDPIPEESPTHHIF